MKIKSLKGMLILSLCIWGGTGALAFVLGKQYALRAMGLDGASGAKGGKDSFSKSADGKSFADIRVKESPPPSLNDLIHATGKPDAGQLARFVSGLSAADCAKVIDDLKTLPAGSRRDAILNAVVDGWAKKNPADFLTNADKLSSPRAKEQGITAALQALAAQDSHAALDWLKNNPGMMGNQAVRYNAIITGLASSNPTDAFNVINGMPDTDMNGKLNAFRAMFEGLGMQGNFNDGVTLLNQLPQGQLKNQAFREMMSQWANSSPEDAAKYVASMDTTNGNGQQRQYYNLIATSWASSDPAAAAAWAASIDQQLAANQPQQGGRGGRGGNVLASTVGQWAAIDLDGAAGFLNSMQSSPSKDQAIRSFVTNAMVQDPEGSLDWVKSMQDPNMQQRMMMETGIQLLSQDPNTFYSTSKLTDAQKQQIIAAAQSGVGQQNIFGQQGGGGRRGGGGGGGGGGNFNNGGGNNFNNGNNNNTGATAGSGPTIIGGNGGAQNGGRRGGGRRGGGGGGGGGGG